jgi:putative DNA primase/helicase
MCSTPEVSISHSPPESLQVSPEGIPPKLKERTQFVNWKHAWGGKKWTKHPYNPRTGRKASSTDLTTWSTFEEVLQAYEDGKYDGIGFVFCSADPFVGIDLDDCRDPETGAIEEWAQKIIDSVVDKYVEASPSGRGVHVITRGVLRGGRKKGALEIYGQERFFTLTGAVL